MKSKNGNIVYYVVEIKSDESLYVLYDTENKGVGCCTMNTLTQLVNKYGYTIKGVTKDRRHNNNLKVCEVSLTTGDRRERKARVICEDLRVLRIGTFLKGLDEKRYPRYTQRFYQCAV